MINVDRFSIATERIVQDPAILSGKPVVKGTRLSVATVLEYLADNPDLDELRADFPRLTIEDVKACFAFAHSLVETAPRATSRSECRCSEGAAPDSRATPPRMIAAPIGAETLWEKVRALEGQTVPTISERAFFDIAAVDDMKVRVVIHSSGSRCTIERERLERAVALGLATSSLTPRCLRGAGIEHPTYAAAILRAIMKEVG